VRIAAQVVALVAKKRAVLAVATLKLVAPALMVELVL
jgi:hypothetical protein